MKKLLAVATVLSVALLSGCNGNTSETGASKTASACDQYFSYMEACFKQMDPNMTAAFQQSMGTMKTQIATMPADQASQLCTQSLEQIKPTMAQMGCK